MSICCFIGHRKIKNKDEISQKLKSIIIDLVVNHQVDTFLFGSKSEFNTLCHRIVTDLQNEYNQIERICYACSNECFCLKKNKTKYTNILENNKISKYVCDYENIIYDNKVLNAGKYSYIIRNQIMIENSEYCIFYYDENYSIDIDKILIKNYAIIMPKLKNSGTKIAYNYAIKKKKTIYSLLK